MTVFNNNRNVFTQAIQSLSPSTISDVQVLSVTQTRRREDGLQVEYGASVLSSQLSTTLDTLNSAASSATLGNSLQSSPTFSAYNVSTSIVTSARAATGGSTTSSSSGLSSGAIAGIVIGSLVGVVLGAVLAVLLMRRANAPRKVSSGTTEEKMVNLHANPAFDPCSSHHSESVS